MEEYEKYKESKNTRRDPIKMVEGVEIEVQGKKKKSSVRDFRNMSQYISAEKNPGQRTEFDDLPRIKTTEINETLEDENPMRRNSTKRVWDKQKKNFVFQKDH